MSRNADELTLIEGGKEHAFSGTAARTAGGLLVTGSEQAVGMVWPQILGVMPYGTDTLVIIASFCLVTLYGSGVAALARVILDRRISELREGMEIDGARIDKITIEGNFPGSPIKQSSVPGRVVEQTNKLSGVALTQSAPTVQASET
jgi:hypothetical protein